MSAPTGRRRAIAKALTALLPLAPYADMEKIRAEAGSVHMKTLPPGIAVWLATIAHIRHAPRTDASPHPVPGRGRTRGDDHPLAFPNYP